MLVCGRTPGFQDNSTLIKTPASFFGGGGMSFHKSKWYVTKVVYGSFDFWKLIGFDILLVFKMLLDKSSNNLKQLVLRTFSQK